MSYDEEQARKKALIHQIRKALQAYRDPEKLDPKFRDSISQTMKREYAKEKKEWEKKYAQWDAKIKEWEQGKKAGAKKYDIAKPKPRRIKIGSE